MIIKSRYTYFIVENVNQHYPALVPLSQAAHGGDDVGVYACGPWAHLFSGVYDQNLLPHLMAFATCIGDETTACN